MGNKVFYAHSLKLSDSNETLSLIKLFCFISGSVLKQKTQLSRDNCVFFVTSTGFKPVTF
ncbi:hypothetical protein BXU11_12265 [Flavobacterium sp. LM5]|nr:hypothetical protein BXU11_12265 [Flavobacterium sp. LM5]